VVKSKAVHLVVPLCALALAVGVAAPVSAAPPGPAAAARTVPAAGSGWAAPVVAGAPVPPRRSDVAGVPQRQPAPVGRVAPAASRVRELVGRRTATGSFYELSDGRTQAELSAAPVHYRDARGGWQPIDTVVRASSRAGFRFGNQTNTFASFFGAGTDSLARVEQAGRWIGLGLAGPRRPVAPVAAGNTVRFAGIARGVDLVYRVTPAQLKEEIVLAAAPADPAFTFTLDTGGLAARQRPDGSIGFWRPSGEGQPLYVLPRPYMTDAADDPASPYGKAYSPKVSQSLAGSGSRLTVTVRADAGWLADPARRYPVVIDPTIKIEPAPSQAQDTMITSDSPSSNYDGSWRLSVGTTTIGAARALLKFPLTGVPAGTALDSAQLRLYYDQTHTTYANDVPMQARRVTAPWSAGTATWSSIAGSTAEVGANVEQVDEGDAGRTAATGAWPYSTNGTLMQYAVNGDYEANKDSVSGDTYTWVPRLTESGDYLVEAHYVPASDRTTVPYTVYYNGGSAAVNVNQAAGTGGVWASLGTRPFLAGTSNKVVLRDSTDPTRAAVADAVRFTRTATDTKKAAVSSAWNTFSVRSIAQAWIDGTAPNYGLTVRATDEATLGRGGPRYEASEYAYGGESANRPKLILTWGTPGVTLSAPTTITATGAQLGWTGYADPSPASSDDIVEYQVHRSIHQTFTPGPATLVAPVPAGTTTFTDTTAVPTPADSPDPFGNAYYYMIAVKTRDGQLIPAATQEVRLPKAGRVTRIFQGGAPDTTLSALRPDENVNVYDGDPYVSAGNNSSYYGVTRGLVQFPSLTGIPAGSTVLDAQLRMWTTYDYGGTDGLVDVHALTRAFDQTTATWNKAGPTTAWTRPGGDYNPTAAGSAGGITNDPEWQSWAVTGVTAGWLANPASNFGLLLKMHDESVASQRVMLLSQEGAEPLLRPKLVVTYLEKTPANTYYAPYTPSRMIPGDTCTVAVTLTNTTTTTWPAASRMLTYHWALPDGTDVTTGGNQVRTALPKDVVPGDTVTVNATVKTPIQSGSGNKREQFVLRWDLLDTGTGQYLSGSGGVGTLDQNVAVEDPTSDQLGLEKFYQYAGRNTGSGGAVMANLSAGNAVWSYNAFSNPSRGVATFVRLAYNSLDTSDPAMGQGWSLSASSLMRLGSPLDLHPPGQDWPGEVTLTDGDGTSHRFALNRHGSTDPAGWDYDHPAGVHLYLQKTGSTDPARAWVMTRPDRTRIFFDADGYQSAVADSNGNELVFTYEQRRSNNKPIKFLRYLTDPAGRQTLTLTYYAKGDSYSYIDDSGSTVQATNLTNPKIIDKVRTITDIAGRQLAFTYTGQGLMAQLVDGAGSGAAKTFRFGYDMTQGNKNVKLVKVTDPRGHDTALAYYDLPTDDPAFHWWARTVTDRLGGVTGFAYTDPDGTAGSQIDTVVSDPNNHTTSYQIDGFGRPMQATNAKGQVTRLHFDADNNVDRLEENNGAVTTWSYDPNTGYPLRVTDAEANHNNTPPATYSYQTLQNGHVADLIGKASPQGRTWAFSYDDEGNLTAVTDPAGTATSTAGDFTTTYTYDTAGQMLTARDANAHTTGYSGYDANGYPQTITDPLNNRTTYSYDVRGQVVRVSDPLQHDTTQTYDIFNRPLERAVGKDASANPPVSIVTPAPVYDPDDNITQTTAPNGAVTSYSYDAADQLTSSSAPRDTATGPARVTSYAYDRAGNLTAQTEPAGTLTPADPDDFVTRYSYDEINEVSAVTNAEGGRLGYTYDAAGNLATVTDPRKNNTVDPADFTTRYDHDLDHRVTTVTDAAGHATATGYDRDGLVVARTDQDGNQTLITLDARGKPAEVRVPHATSGGTIGYDTTRYEYDQVGNQTKVVSPRGAATSGVSDDFVQQTSYDELNRVRDKLTPYDPNDSRYNAPDRTTYSYDAAGRLSRVSAPPSDGQTVRNDTTYTYWDNGWARTSTDPWDITTSYDENALGKQTARTITSAGGSSARTMTWDYYPDGKLKSRSDDGVPVGSQVVLVDNTDAQNVTVTGTWPTGTTGGGYQGYNYATHPGGGTGGNSFGWNLVIPQDGNYDVYVRYATATATNAHYTVTHSGGSAAKVVDQTTGGGTWVSLGRYAFTAAGSDQQVTLTDEADGTVVADAVKLVRDNSADVDNERTAFSYGYDANGNPTDIADASPGATTDDYTVTYTGLNQVASVAEAKNGTTRHTTTFGYDENGNLLTRGHDAQTASYSYDERDLPVTITDAKSATDPDPKVSRFTYTARGQRLHEVKANGNTVDYSYYLDGALQHQIEKKADGTLVAEHTLAYDPNGNKTGDDQRLMNADNHSAYLSRTTAYTYDPRDRIATVRATDAGGATLSAESYFHDANNNVVSQTVKSATTTFNYDRNRLLYSVQDGARANYNYDPFGRLDTVTAAGQVIEKVSYDGFDRVAADRRGAGTSASTTAYTYDPFDRTTTRTANAGGSAEKTTAYSYLGLSDHLLDERVGGQLTKSYQYSPWGERLSQVSYHSDGSSEDGYYDYNSHSDVESVTDSNGDTKATYGYTAYGDRDDGQTTGVDKPDVQDPAKEPYNAYRFNGKRWDPSSGDYDMGFRDYNPGLNRFLSRDMYNGALADQNLATDPFTGNRYAFGGGNPVTSIELDGHRPADCDGECLKEWLAEQRKAEFIKQMLDYNAEHSAAVLATVSGIRSSAQFQKVGGGTITTRMMFNCIPGGSVKNPDNQKVCGYADILLHAKDGNVYVWEVKAEGSAAEAYPQIDLYIRMLNKRGDSARRGWDLPQVAPVPVPRTGGMLRVYSAPQSGAGPTGIRLYERLPRPEPEPEPKPVPVPVPAPQPNTQPVPDDGGGVPGWVPWAVGGAAVVGGVACFASGVCEVAGAGGALVAGLAAVF
jgi:RHS repeat-associated protein